MAVVVSLPHLSQRPRGAFNGALNYCVSGMCRGGMRQDIFTSLLPLWEKVARTKSVPDEGLRSRGEGKNLEFRRTFFRKGLDAFLDLGAVHAVAMAAVGGFLFQPVAGEFV